MKQELFIVALVALSLASESFAYEVREGDTLSQISANEIGRPVFGAKGSLRKLLRLNPQIVTPNLIRVGRIIRTAPDTLDVRKPAADDVEADVEVEVKDRVLSESARPTKTVEQKSQPEQTSQPEAVEKSHVWISPAFAFHRVDSRSNATGANSILASNLSTGFDAFWMQTWSANWSSAVGIRGESYLLTTTGGSVSDPNVFAYSLEGRASYHETPKSKLSLKAGIEKSPYTVPGTQSTVVIFTAVIPQVALEYERAVAQSRLFSLDLGAAAGLRFPVSQEAFNTQLGSRFDGFIQIRQISGHPSLASQFYVSRVEQNTSLTKQSETILGFRIGADFDFTPSLK